MATEQMIRLVKLKSRLAELIWCLREVEKNKTSTQPKVGQRRKEDYQRKRDAVIALIKQEFDMEEKE